MELDTIAKECGFDSWQQLLFENMSRKELFEIFCEYIDDIPEFKDDFLDMVIDLFERHDLVNRYREED